MTVRFRPRVFDGEEGGVVGRESGSTPPRLDPRRGNRQSRTMGLKGIDDATGRVRWEGEMARKTWALFVDYDIMRPLVHGKECYLLPHASRCWRWMDGKVADADPAGCGYLIATLPRSPGSSVHLAASVLCPIYSPGSLFVANRSLISSRLLPRRTGDD